MKINSATMMEVKTREEELEDLLLPDGMLNRNIYVAVMKIRNATTAKEVEIGCGRLDDAIKLKIEEQEKNLKDKEKFEKMMKENERNLEWLDNFKMNLDSILAI